MGPTHPRSRQPTGYAPRVRAARRGLNLPRPLAPASALATAARAALRAPSIHNTQPWRWQLDGERLALYANRRWQLSAADPQGRLLLLSCGAALHHVRVALRAMGYLPAVRRFPDPTRPDLLAYVTVDKSITVTGHAVDLMRAMLSRHTDRHELRKTPLPETALTQMRQAASSEGVWLHLLNRDQARRVITAAARSDTAEYADPEYRRELRSWTGRNGGSTDGIPEAALSPRGGGYPDGNAYLLLYGNGDRAASWLRAGEALSAVWLTATVHGLAMQPVSSVIEVPAGRAVLCQVLSGAGSPYLVLRAGFPATDNQAVPTPRRPAGKSIEES